jgi:hypothetical protein
MNYDSIFKNSLTLQVQNSLRSRRLISFDARVKNFIFAVSMGFFQITRIISPPAYNFTLSFQFADGFYFFAADSEKSVAFVGIRQTVRKINSPFNLCIFVVCVESNHTENRYTSRKKLWKNLGAKTRPKTKILG